jgi:hypothetical protein
MKLWIVETDKILNQCRCGQCPPVYGHYIKGTANHINYFTKCSCGIRTRNRRTVDGTIDDWNNEIFEGEQ